MVQIIHISRPPPIHFSLCSQRYVLKSPLTYSRQSAGMNRILLFITTALSCYFGGCKIMHVQGTTEEMEIKSHENKCIYYLIILP